MPLSDCLVASEGLLLLVTDGEHQLTVRAIPVQVVPDGLRKQAGFLHLGWEFQDSQSFKRNKAS